MRFYHISCVIYNNYVVVVLEAFWFSGWTVAQPVNLLSGLDLKNWIKKVVFHKENFLIVMLPDKTIKKLWSVYGALCSCGTLPYKTSRLDDTSIGSTLRHILPTDLKYNHLKILFFTTFFHTIFITYRFYQAWHIKTSKIFLLFVHFAWFLAFTMICWLYITLYRSRFDVMAYCNGLFKFYGSFISMPGERLSGEYFN